MKIQEVEKKIFELINTNKLIDEEINSFTLLKQLGFNSLNIIELIVIIEDEFLIEFNDYDLSFDKFKTIRSISQLVIEKINNK